MRVRRWPGFLLVAVAALPGSALAQQQPPAPPAPTEPPAQRRGFKLAVVDTCLLFRDYVRRPAFEEAIEAERDAIRKELEAKAEGSRRSGGRPGLDKTPVTPGDEEWLRRRDEIRRASDAFDRESERWRKQYLARRDQLLERLLDEIDGVVRDYGKRHGYDVILRSDDLAALGDGDGELIAALRDRLRAGPRPPVAFHSEAVDLTFAVQRELHGRATQSRLEARDLELGLSGRGASPKVPLWPHLAALTPPADWRVEARPGEPERTRWHAEGVVRGLGDGDGPTGVVTVARLIDDQGRELQLVLPPLPVSGPFTWKVPFAARHRLDVFRREDGERQGTAVALRELPSGRLLLFYDDGILPPCGVEDMDDLTATLTPLPPGDEGAAVEDAWVATTLRLDRGNDSVTLRDDDPPAALGRSGLVARVVRARIFSGADPRQVAAWLVWRPVE